jgi:hypothetical protein
MLITAQIKNDVTSDEDYFVLVQSKGKEKSYFNISYLEAIKKFGIKLPEKYEVQINGNSIAITY